MISQNNKPIAFYSRKLQPAQRQYTTTEHKLLSIIKTLKEFKNILLGQQILVYTNHKNLIYKNFNTEHIMRWQFLIEEFGHTKIRLIHATMKWCVLGILRIMLSLLFSSSLLLLSFSFFLFLFLPIA